jgi:hypothetical protein
MGCVQDPSDECWLTHGPKEQEVAAVPFFALNHNGTISQAVLATGGKQMIFVEGEGN